MSIDIEKEKINFVEKMALKMEAIGLPRIACQILSWLMVCTPSQQSFSDLIDNLNISKASISNMTRLLIQMGLIEKVRIQGKRQIYFQIKENAWVDVMEIRIKQILDVVEFSGEAISTIKKDSNTDITKLEEMNRFYAFLADEIPELIERYKKSDNI